MQLNDDEVMWKTAEGLGQANHFGSYIPVYVQSSMGGGGALGVRGRISPHGVLFWPAYRKGPYRLSLTRLAWKELSHFSES